MGPLLEYLGYIIFWPFLAKQKLLLKIKNTTYSKKIFTLDLDSTFYEESNHVLHVISWSALL
jgi:hypothetical protein